MTRKQSCRKGFTLIELLVVIAIIAILAAILFPVFAQAKAAAKATQSLSNQKNLMTASLIYVTDYDDVFMVGATWGVGAGHGVLFDGVGPNSYKAWPMIIEPYIKNADVFFDPQIGGKGSIAGLRPIEYANFRTHYGFNQINLAYWNGQGTSLSDFSWIPVSTTAVANSSETVMFTNGGDVRERFPFVAFEGDNLQAYGIWGAGAVEDYNGPILETVAFPPFCDYDAERWYCFDWNWWGPINTTVETVEAGFFTGGNGMRRNRQMITSFTDGHVKSLPYARLAAGTDFVLGENLFGDYVALTDKSEYLWDLE